MLKHKIINWSIFIFLSVIWGTSFILMKIANEELTGIEIGSIRIFAAGLVFLPFSIFHLPKIPRGKLLLVIVSGFLGSFFPAYLFAIAIENKIDSSLAGILNSLTPLLVIVIGIIFFKSSIRRKKITGVIVGFIGLVILSLSEGGISLQNYAFASLILLGTLMYAFNINIVSKYLKEVEPMHIATVSLSFMTVFAGILLWYQGVGIKLQQNNNVLIPVIIAALLGIVASALATALFYVLIKRAGGLFASLVTYAIPVVAIFWGVSAGEQVTIIQIACLFMILGGVYLANKN
ncbi:MAG: DMT family transporter [Bacteroidota bacterium]|jgi:drug/metabolite transporter (DMT)-like permease|nr:DMT family transporter [Bacteroidota bacterium]